MRPGWGHYDDMGDVMVGSQSVSPFDLSTNQIGSISNDIDMILYWWCGIMKCYASVMNAVLVVIITSTGTWCCQG